MNTRDSRPNPVGDDLGFSLTPASISKRAYRAGESAASSDGPSEVSEGPSLANKMAKEHP
jgi:hypothetical protein